MNIYDFAKVPYHFDLRNIMMIANVGKIFYNTEDDSLLPWFCIQMRETMNIVSPICETSS